MPPVTKSQRNGAASSVRIEFPPEEVKTRLQKLGPKGVLTVAKELRELVGLVPGKSLVYLTPVGTKGILLQRVQADQIVKALDRQAALSDEEWEKLRREKGE